MIKQVSRFKQIYVEISNSCNLKCHFCPTPGASTLLSPQKFENVLHKISGHCEQIALHLLGEPLLHPELKEILSIATRSQVPINLTTNGLLLRRNLWEALIDASIRQINFSLQSFAANFPNQSPEAYIKNIFAFIKEAHGKKPDLYFNLRLWDFEDSQTLNAQNEEIRSLIGSHFQFSFAEHRFDLRSRRSIRIAPRVFLHCDSRFEWPSLSQPFRSQTGTCYGLRHQLAIHANGTVVPCCLDQNAVINLGNILDQDLESIISTSRAKGIREGFERGELREDLCQRCTYIKRFDGKRQFSVNVPKVDDIPQIKD